MQNITLMLIRFLDKRKDKQEVDIGFFKNESHHMACKRKSVLKCQASAKSSCWANCDKNFICTCTLRKGTQVSRKFKLDSYKNESHQMTCQRIECAKLSSICNEYLLRKLQWKFLIHSMDRRTDKKEIDIGFVQKWIPPYCTLKKIVYYNFKHLRCWTTTKISYTLYGQAHR
jgi:hypothetical protein